MAGKDSNIGAKRAREARASLGLEPAEPVGCLLTLVEEVLDIPVVIAALPETVAGCCWRGPTGVVVWINGTQAAVRQRFTLAHELGHVRCGHDHRIEVDTFETLAGKTTDSREIQANAFAAELLAPADGVTAMAPAEPSLDDVVLLAARFGISTIAALYRLNSLGLAQRYETLRDEIDAGRHYDAWERLEPAPYEDTLGTLGVTDLPRLSPKLERSALGALVRGDTSIEDAAAAAAADHARLAKAASNIGI